jgi:hypothetical protein
MDIISDSKEQSVVLDIPGWMSRATLDAIGEGRVMQVHSHLFLISESFSCF